MAIKIQTDIRKLPNGTDNLQHYNSRFSFVHDLVVDFKVLSVVKHSVLCYKQFFELFEVFELF